MIFSNILEVYEMTANLLSLLEDTLEVTDEDGMLLVGACFEELAEVIFLSVSSYYSHDFCPCFDTLLWIIIIQIILLRRC